MRELTVRLRFTSPSLGNVKRANDSGRFYFQRNAQGQVVFMASWHLANMKFAAKIAGKHQSAVKDIAWDVSVHGQPLKDNWYKRYYHAANQRQRYSLHEAFREGQIIGLNCCAPEEITDDDLWELLRIAGQYRGISPWRPGEFGFYTVESIRARRTMIADDPNNEDVDD